MKNEKSGDSKHKKMKKDTTSSAAQEKGKNVHQHWK